jgi:hypothetical protein
MSRKIRIALALTLAGALLIAAPTVALAGSPLLSGYGGPGAGEQAIIGSPLLNGPHGGAGSGGSSGSGGSLGGPSSGSGAANGSAGGAGSSQAATGGSGSDSGSTSSNSVTGAKGSASGASRSSGALAKRADAYVYPRSLALASSDSSVIGISSGDVLLLIGIIATLALVGVFTVRLARLQP